MGTILSTETKIQIAYLYSNPKSYQTFQSLGKQYNVSAPTISKAIHEIIEKAIIPRSLVFALRDKAVNNVKQKNKSYYKVLNSFNDSIKIYEESLKNIWKEIILTKSSIASKKCILNGYERSTYTRITLTESEKDIVVKEICSEIDKLANLTEIYNLRLQ